MLEVIYERNGVEQVSYFFSKEEFEEWLVREKHIWPELNIINVNED